MSAVDQWAARIESFGLVPTQTPDDPGVLFMHETDTETGRFPRKVGLIVIRDNRVTYAEVDGHVMDTITSDRRPLDVQLLDTLGRRIGRRS